MELMLIFNGNVVMETLKTYRNGTSHVTNTSCLCRWILRTWLLSRRAPTASTLCGKAATLHSQSLSTGAIGFWRYWWAYHWHWSGASSSPFFPSCTSGQLCHVWRAAWSRSTVSARSTPSVCTPSVTRCTRLSGRSSATSGSPPPPRWFRGTESEGSNRGVGAGWKLRRRQ